MTHLYDVYCWYMRGFTGKGYTPFLYEVRVCSYTPTTRGTSPKPVGITYMNYCTTRAYLHSKCVSKLHIGQSTNLVQICTFNMQINSFSCCKQQLSQSKNV